MRSMRRRLFYIPVLAMVLSFNVSNSFASQDNVRVGYRNDSGTVTVEASSSGVVAEAPVATGPAASKPLTMAEIQANSHLWERPEEVGLAGGRSYVSYHPAPRDSEAVDYEGLAARAVARMQIPEAQIVFGPEPSVNEWNAIPVNFPIWLDLGAKRAVSQTAVEDAIRIELSASLANTYWQMGDGSAFSCSAMTARPSGVQNPPRPSPTCGYTYTRKGDYQVSAISTWQVNWSVNGRSGVMTVARGGARTLKINELRSLITR